VGRMAGEPGTEGALFPSSAVCVCEDEDDVELEEATSGAASEETSPDAAGFFQRRYTLCIAGFFTLVSGDGDADSGATYPMDITSPRWLA